MRKKKFTEVPVKKKGKSARFLHLHVYGIFDVEKQSIIKVSLDPSEIQMEIALMGNFEDNLVECEFDIKLAL